MTGRDEVLDLLPVAYAAALRLRAAGVDDAGIAARLQMPPQAVPLLLAVAEAKRARLAGNDADPPAAGTSRASPST